MDAKKYNALWCSSGVNITIDPGLSGTGYAIWVDKSLYLHGVVAGAAKGRDIETRVVSLTDTVVDTLDDAVDLSSSSKGTIAVFIESSGFHRSTKGTAALLSGSLVKLTMFVGALLTRLSMYERVRMQLIEPVEWKGNANKSIIKKRIQRRIGICPKEHEADAIGIGLSIMELL